MPDCLLKNTSTKHNKYVVNQKFEHVEDKSSENFLVESEWYSTNKICLFLAQGICNQNS